MQHQFTHTVQNNNVTCTILVTSDLCVIDDSKWPSCFKKITGELVEICFAAK